MEMEYRVVVRHLSKIEEDVWSVHEYYPAVDKISETPVVVTSTGAGELRETILRIQDAMSRPPLLWEDF